jgi:hypothetical protein
MEDQAQRLAEAVAVFKVGEQHTDLAVAEDAPKPVATVTPLPRRAQPAAAARSRSAGASAAQRG